MNPPAYVTQRLERFLYGDFLADDLTHLFLFLREASFGRQTVREVGDFIAHRERDKGPSTELAKNFFKVMRFQTALMDKKVTTLLGLSVPVEVLEASFATLGQEVVRRETKLKPQAAKNAFRKLLAKANTVKGTAQAKQLDPQEAALLQCLLTHYTVKHAFDDENLFKEVCEVLQKNKLLASGDLEALKQRKALISLHAIVHMHQCDLLLDDGSHAHLMASRSSGLLEVVSSAPCPTDKIPTLHIAHSFFQTALRADDCCASELLEGDAGLTKWDFALEIGPDQKLSRLQRR